MSITEARRLCDEIETPQNDHLKELKYQLAKLHNALVVIRVWAANDKYSGRDREREMEDIVRKCDEALGK